MSFPAAQNAVVGAVPPEAIGKATGTNTTLRELGGVFGIALSVAFFAGGGQLRVARGRSRTASWRPWASPPRCRCSPPARARCCPRASGSACPPRPASIADARRFRGARGRRRRRPWAPLASSPPGSCSGSASAASWTASSSTRSCSGITCSPARASTRPRPWRGWRRTRSPTASSTPRPGSPRWRACWLLWRADARAASDGTARELLGAALAGWGAFNLVEGIVDHHLLGLHHVRPGDAELAYDLGFLALGGALVIAGAYLIRSARLQHSLHASTIRPVADATRRVRRRLRARRSAGNAAPRVKCGPRLPPRDETESVLSAAGPPP